MYRQQPVVSKILQKKWVSYEQDVHERKLSEVKSRLRSVSPPKFRHVVKNLKREQRQEERYTEIERENRILLEKMSNIMSHRQNNSFLNNSRSSSVKRSLNRNQRKKEMTKITNENQALLRRLQDRKPVYNVHRWESERKRQEHLMKNMCEYPLVSLNGSESVRRRRGHSRPVSTTRPRSHLPKLTSDDSSLNRTFVKRKKANNNPVTDQNRLILYKKGIQHRTSYYIVEISQTNRTFFIVAFDAESPDSYVLKYPSEEGRRIVTGFNHDYDAIIDHLTFGPQGIQLDLSTIDHHHGGGGHELTQNSDINHSEGRGGENEYVNRPPVEKNTSRNLTSDGLTSENEDTVLSFKNSLPEGESDRKFSSHYRYLDRQDKAKSAGTFNREAAVDHVKREADSGGGGDSVVDNGKMATEEENTAALIVLSGEDCDDFEPGVAVFESETRSGHQHHH